MRLVTNILLKTNQFQLNKQTVTFLKKVAKLSLVFLAIPNIIFYLFTAGIAIHQAKILKEFIASTNLDFNIIQFLQIFSSFIQPFCLGFLVIVYFILAGYFAITKVSLEFFRQDLPSSMKKVFIFGLKTAFFRCLSCFVLAIILLFFAQIMALPAMIASILLSVLPAAIAGKNQSTFTAIREAIILKYASGSKLQLFTRLTTVSVLSYLLLSLAYSSIQWIATWNIFWHSQCLVTAIGPAGYEIPLFYCLQVVILTMILSATAAGHSILTAKLYQTELASADLPQ